MIFFYFFERGLNNKSYYTDGPYDGESVTVSIGRVHCALYSQWSVFLRLELWSYAVMQKAVKILSAFPFIDCFCYRGMVNKILWDWAEPQSHNVISGWDPDIDWDNSLAEVTTLLLLSQQCYNATIRTISDSPDRTLEPIEVFSVNRSRFRIDRLSSVSNTSINSAQGGILSLHLHLYIHGSQWSRKVRDQVRS